MAAALAPCEYKTGRTLGQGSYASVKEAVHVKTGERFAVKVISKKLMAGREHMILNEIEILKKVSKGHKNIVTLHDYFETPNNLYLVMDLCTGGELFDRICEKGSFYEEDAAEIVRTVVDAVAYLHDQNIVHRDLKPENLLYRNKETLADLVIADFGLSKIMDANTFEGLMTTCGTPGYMAPEVILKTGHGKSVDMWSIGVLTYFLLCGYTPFDSGNNAEEVQRVLGAQYSFTPSEYWQDVSETARDFIRACLLVDPTARMTAHQALAHPWMEFAPLIQPDGTSVPTRVPTIDLLPNVKQRFDAKKTFKKGVDAIIALGKMNRSLSLSLGKLADGGSELDISALRPNDETGADGQLMVLNRVKTH
ncbi:calcium/calmodulin-dependent protein kinase type I [Zopfochytrium polystomum]|nr:calcium/calmodulin-dependent protein kinase type I [Zopfochytrium polystomum]